MVFSSILFLFFFLPVVLGIYYLSPDRFRNYFLLFASLFFYAFGEPVFVILLIFSISLNYFCGLQIDKRKSKARKGWMICAIALNLSVLIIFKYLNFFLSSISALLGLSLSISTFSLPLGISFYTFQLISYIVDVYRKDTPVQKNPAKLALYIAMFPQLVAGPIVRYSDLAEQIDRRQLSASMVSSGLSRFITGLSKKCLWANSLGIIADHAFSQTALSLTTGTAWLGAFAYTLQIYFDFSGYSDMAIGLGKMLGFQFQENFDHPYAAKSITEFWRRWHISLSSWFRDYVYIPLGGNRRSIPRSYFNLMLVWLLTGLWHGAAWTFVLWGCYYGIILMAERRLRFKDWGIPSAWKHFCTMFIVMIGWVIFRADSLSQLLLYLQSMFRWNGPYWNANTLLYIHDNWIWIASGLLICTPIPHRMLLWLRNQETALSHILYWAIAFTLFFVSILYLVNGTYNPFIYFRF